MTARLDIPACVEANTALYARHPELGRRHLTSLSGDAGLRQEWWSCYDAALKDTPKPPAPGILPQPTALTGSPASGPLQMSALNPANMTHGQKIEQAIASAVRKGEMPPAVRPLLGDPGTLAASMVIAGATLAGIGTDYGRVSEAISNGLLIVGSSTDGKEIGIGLDDFMHFFNATRCDTAASYADLDAAGAIIASAMAKMGADGMKLLLTAVAG